MKKVMIVGAGISGIISAIKLRHHGYDVTIIDKNEHIGGKINLKTKDDFTFDLGFNTLIKPDLYDEVFNYVGKDPNDYFSKTSYDSNHHLYFSNEDQVELQSDLTHLNEMLEKLRKKEKSLSFHFLHRIDDHSKKHKSFDYFNHTILVHIKNKKLRDLLSFQFLCFKTIPYTSSSLNSLISMIEGLNSNFMIKEGMLSYIQGLEKLMHEMGVKILNHTHVDEIFISNKQAKGVVLGEDIYCADVVLNNTDFAYAMKNLIKDEKNRAQYTNKKLEKMSYSTSAFIMVLRINQKLNHLNVHNIILPEEFENTFKNNLKPSLSATPSMYMYVPSKLNTHDDVKGYESLIIVVPVENLNESNQTWNENLIQSYRQIILNQIASMHIIENLEKLIISETILTPHDLENQVHAHYGALFGLVPTLRHFNHLNPQPKFKDIHHFYHTCSSSQPQVNLFNVNMDTQECINEILKNDPNGSSNACEIYASEFEKA